MSEQDKIIQGWVHRFALPAADIPKRVMQDDELYATTLRYAIDHKLINTDKLFPHMKTRRMIGEARRKILADQRRTT